MLRDSGGDYEQEPQLDCPLMRGNRRPPVAGPIVEPEATHLVTVGGLRARSTSYASLPGSSPSDSPPSTWGAYRSGCSSGGTSPLKAVKAAALRACDNATSHRRLNLALSGLLATLIFLVMLHYSMIGYCLGRDGDVFVARQGTSICRLHRSLPDYLRYRAGFRKPVSRGDLSKVLNGPGSLFGHVHMKMECPIASEVGSVGSGPSGSSMSEGGLNREYTPSMLFPLSRAQPQRTAVPREWDGQLSLLIGVLSSCSARAERDTARNTWQRLAVPEGSTYRVIFILSNQCKSEAQEEAELYGDLEFFDVSETYYALTPKVFKFFEYAREIGAKYTMKTDDDTFVFVDRLLMELERMPESCLYWGGAEKLPGIDQYPWTGLNVPLNKWYIQKSDFKVIAGTPYMAGGGYILSRDLADRVVERSTSIPWVDRMPEDATLGRVLGWSTYSKCHCHDSRHLKHVTQFQGAQLFSEGIFPCERADVSRRMLTMHGFKNMTQMWEVFRYTTEDWDLGCMVNGRNYARKQNNQFWGREIPGEAAWINPIARTQKLNVALTTSLTSNPWNLRKWYRPYQSIWGSSPLGDAPAQDGFLTGKQVNEIVPLSAALEEMVGGLPEAQRKDSSLPWCTRLLWASQVMGIMQELGSRHALVCDMTIKSFYINTTTLQVHLNRGDVPQVYSPSKRFHSDSVCFTSLQCMACYLRESRDWLTENTQCNTEENRCVGYDALAQTKVAIRSVIRVLLPPGWASVGWGISGASGTPADLEQQVGTVLGSVLQKSAFPQGGESDEDYVTSSIDAAVQGIKSLMSQSRAGYCASVRANGLRRALGHVIPRPAPIKKKVLKRAQYTLFRD